MLTKKDLQLIRAVVREEIGAELEPIKKDIKTIKSDIVHIRKDSKTVVNFFDKEYLDLRNRIERLEEILKLPPIN